MDENNFKPINKVNFRPQRRIKKSYLVTGVSLFILLILGTSLWLFTNKLIVGPKNVLGIKFANSDNVNSDEVKKLTEEIGKIVELPLNEQPTIATVTDTTQLKEQPFFQKTKNGDKVLIYPSAKIAILYDPLSHRVRNMAALNSVDSPAKSQNQQARIVIRNGTSSAGLATKIEADIKKAFPDATITAKENAAKDSYDKTVIVAANEGAKNAAFNLAKALNVLVGDLPGGEKPSPNDADIIIITGKDKI